MSDIVKIIALDWRNGMLFIAAIIILAVFILQKTDWLAERFGITSKRKMAEDKRNQEIKELKDHAEKSDENFEKVFASIETLQESINAVSDRVAEMQRRNDENERSKLKDRIAQSYRYHKSHGYWSSMDKEAFDDLVKAYENAGGENSFIHSVCIPTSLQWDIVDE